MQKIKILFLLIIFCHLSSCALESDKNTEAINDFVYSINKYDVSVIENYIGAEKMPLFRQLYSYTDKRRLVFDSVFVEGNTAYAIDFNSDTLTILFERSEDDFKIFLSRNSMLTYFGDKISESEYFPIVSYYLNLDDTANSNYFYRLQLMKSNKAKRNENPRNGVYRSQKSVYFLEIEAMLGNSNACYILNQIYPEFYSNKRDLFYQEPKYARDECVECFGNRYNIEHCKETCLKYPSSRGFNKIAKFYEEHLIEDSTLFWKAKADELKLREEQKEVKGNEPAYCAEDFPKFHLISE